MRESDVTEQGHSGRHPHLRGDINGEGHAGGADMHHVRTRSCGERWTRERCKPHLRALSSTCAKSILRQTSTAARYALLITQQLTNPKRTANPRAN